MARRIVCPSCGTEGEAAIDDRGEFEVRGQYKGKAVRRCRTCGAGLALGPFTGIFFGKPRLIPIDVWQRMEAKWARAFGAESQNQENGHRDWEELTEGERGQLKLMIISLQEFSYAFQRANEIAESAEESGADARFYSNALYQYCASYFTISGPFKLRVQLSQLGNSDLLEAIVDLLGTQLGETTFGEIIDVFRDKFLVHQSFRLSVLDKHIFKKYDMADENNALHFGVLVRELFRLTQELYVNLTMRFPEAT